jgi:hypothetical protein
VICTCLVNKKLVASIFTLIFWRAVCDLMISVAFIVMPKFQQYIRRHHCEDDDGSSGTMTDCADNDDWLIDHEDKCLPMSLWLEFFQIASESWLLCITYDLVVTISNPFTSLSYRLSLSLPAIPTRFTVSLLSTIPAGSNTTISSPGVWAFS